VNRLEKIHHGARTDRQICVTLLHPSKKLSVVTQSAHKRSVDLTVSVLCSTI
jgi:hypothetical protein